MRFVSIVALALALQACGTIGGAVSGAGDDLGRAGQYIKNVGK